MVLLWQTTVLLWTFTILSDCVKYNSILISFWKILLHGILLLVQYSTCSRKIYDMKPMIRYSGIKLNFATKARAFSIWKTHANYIIGWYEFDISFYFRKIIFHFACHLQITNIHRNLTKVHSNFKKVVIATGMQYVKFVEKIKSWENYFVFNEPIPITMKSMFLMNFEGYACILLI